MLVTLAELVNFTLLRPEATSGVEVLILPFVIMNLLGLITSYFQRRMHHLGSRKFVFLRNALWIASFAFLAFSEYAEEAGSTRVNATSFTQSCTISYFLCLVASIVAMIFEIYMRYIWAEGFVLAASYTYLTLLTPPALVLFYGREMYTHQVGLGRAVYAVSLWSMVCNEVAMVPVALLGLVGVVRPGSVKYLETMMFAVVYPLGLALLTYVTLGLWPSAAHAGSALPTAEASL